MDEDKFWDIYAEGISVGRRQGKEKALWLLRENGHPEAAKVLVDRWNLEKGSRIEYEQEG